MRAKDVKDYKIVGTSQKRIDLPPKLTGEFTYANDVRLPGMLHGRVVRPPTITAKPASVTPDAASKTYGSADPALTGTLSGFLEGDAVTASYSRTAGESVAGSPYTISATLSPAGVLGNYTITSNTADFTINKATASVTPSAAKLRAAARAR